MVPSRALSEVYVPEQVRGCLRGWASDGGRDAQGAIVSDTNRWVKCKGCGVALVLFTDGSRRVGHAKPVALVGVPNSVPCALFKASTAERMWALHKDAEPITPPDDFRPARN
jgi:hypothetical protein